MKKMIMIFCALFSIGFLTFADTNSNKSFEDENYSRDNRSFSKNIGFAPGLRLSIMGLEPTFDLFINNLELEGACVVSTGLTGETFGFAPSFSIGYNTKPFGRGVAAVFGGEYMYLSPMYTGMISVLTNNGNPNNTISVHAFSMFYKGVVNFNSTVGLSWRFRLPLFIGGYANDSYYNLNFLNLAGFGACSLIGLCTISIGVQFTF